MLTKILSVSGRPGLYKLVSTGKNLNIVESLADGKRIPVYVQEKAVALSDVSIYTAADDVPLKEVLTKIKEKENGNPVTIGAKPSNKELFDYLEQILPDYDTEKVYASDIKKLLSWYNILVEHGIDFEKAEKEEEAEGKSDDGETPEEN
ncbi:MAG TPA: hypothetical protein DDZ96_10145 [Porphyromonadaceae bacterium]|jgi:hypothetical protein|uniref:DUF5606 family protein n=1 Tax=Limibacterium fermenti TaxID=3229863 RepID=UPI000E84A0C9|nr:hypothetical protein [Porphyromonadaceae bacterium]HBK30652.1 hypothetical protein [Porphyromonadaceae bacterium]HBL34158.1 hypothetical protein [Porphyromonadaceae bacterium]HBX20446.1 hypothetical protein [Porphyromonadaceae bacterium]HBX46207.1 hypothetical protein [Porphyromonadaceae bacterium]